MRRVAGRWLADPAASAEQGYALRVSAACTADVIADLRQPLPAATRAGLASEARRESAHARRLVFVMERADPPPGMDDERERVARAVRATVGDWRRAERGLRGVASPIKAFRKAGAAVNRRYRAVREDWEALGISCGGASVGRRDADAYRSRSERVCRAAARQLDRRTGPAVARVGAIVRTTARRLRRVGPPQGLERLHRRTVDAFAAAYAQLPRLARRRDVDRAVEALELSGLRAAIGFVRLELGACAEL